MFVLGNLTLLFSRKILTWFQSFMDDDLRNITKHMAGIPDFSKENNDFNIIYIGFFGVAMIVFQIVVFAIRFS